MHPPYTWKHPYIFLHQGAQLVCQSLGWEENPMTKWRARVDQLPKLGMVIPPLVGILVIGI